MMEQSAVTGTVTVVAQAAINIPVGFSPSYVRAINVNNLTSYEWFYGMTAGTSLDNANHADTQWSVNAADGISQYTGRTPGAAISGTVTTNGTTTLAGSSTNFLGELAVGDLITVSGESRNVVAIASATSLTVDSAFTTSTASLTAYDMTGKGLGFTLGSDICDTGSDVVRWLAIR